MNNHSETTAIKKVINDYREGTYRADTKTLRSVFHEKAVMNGYLGPDPLIADPSDFIVDIGSSPSMESKGDPYQAEIESIRIEGNVASVILSETGFRGQGVLVDFFHLIKTNGKWQIISKLFTTV
jgi:protease I